MKKYLLSVCTLLFLAMLPMVSHAGGDRERVPKVRYLAPRSEAVVDLTGQESLEFTWSAMPKPSGGRMAYRFTIYKGFGYERIMNEILDRKTYSYTVPAEMFENGQLYTWQVLQRDDNTRYWSMDNRWSFTIKK